VIGEMPQHDAGETQVSAEPTDTATLPVQVSRADPFNTAASAQNRTWTDLSRAERRVMTVLRDPDNHEKTESERIALAKVSRSRYYEILRDPDFARMEREIVRDTIRASVGAVIHKSLEVAVKRDRDGFNDRKLLLSMSGHYVERSQTDITSQGKQVVGVIGVSMDAL
jgi:hypothetical protein